MRRIAIVVVTLLGMLIAAPALAGGSWLDSTEQTYQPGETVTAVGFVETSSEDWPVTARLNLVPAGPGTEHTSPIWHELGPMTVEPTPLGDHLSYRDSIEFTLPSHLEPGSYWVELLDGSGRYVLIGLEILVDIESTEPPGSSGHSTTHAISVSGSEAGEGLPSLPSPTVRVEPVEDGGSPTGRVVIVIGLGLVAALFAARSMRRPRPNVEAEKARPREIETSGRR